MIHRVGNSQNGQLEWISKLYRMNVALVSLLDSAANCKCNALSVKSALKFLTEILEVKYGALALISKNNTMDDFIYIGVSEKVAHKIGSLPVGKGLLGIVVKENHLLNIKNIHRDPEKCGFPPHHPDMTTLLAAPIALDNKIYGRVYLSEKLNGKSFDQQDEYVISNFANILAVIIQHRALFEKCLKTNENLTDSVHKAAVVKLSAYIKHNIGNVLNNINVSVNMIYEKLDNTPLNKLLPLMELLKQHSDDLASFFKNDEKGKHILEYLIELSNYSKETHEVIMKEINLLAESVDKIKTIIFYKS